VAHVLRGRDTLDGRCEVYPLLIQYLRQNEETKQDG